MAIVWRSGLTYQPTGGFGGLGSAERGLAAALQPGGIENYLTIEDVDRLEMGAVPWPMVRRCPSARLTAVRDRGFRKAGRTIMALLAAGEGARRKTIGLDRFELGLIEAAAEPIRLDVLLRQAASREPRPAAESATTLRRLTAVGALLARWPTRHGS